MGDRKTKKTMPWVIIMKRELSAYFTSPVAYIVGAIFILLSGIFFFNTFFLMGRAELRGFFELLPIFFSFLIPALTMRIFSEEKKSGTMETLVTLPVKTADIVWGKYMAVLVSTLVMIAPTLFYVVTCVLFASSGIDAGPVLGGYFGSILLASAFSAIGIFCSAITRNQIVAFLLSLSICLFLTFVMVFAIFLPGFMVPAATFVSAQGHFRSIARGILDSRDILYFISVSAAFYVLTVNVLDNERKG
ncbi:ABC transporter permease subunit [Treponema sp.]|uniref:ABC transporter permease subunit n=1 Tax=Treponema sp. TaxID=166 RepID=UPI0038908815